MAHEISVRNGKVEMVAANGISVWWESDSMSAGRLDPEADIDDWLQKSNMGNMKIQRSKVRYATNEKATTFLEIPDRHVLFRSDTKEALGVVSADYKIVQPRDVLETFREITRATGYRMATAGMLFGGKRFWAAASIGREAYVGDRADRVGGYILLNSSADGSSATEGRSTTTCVVCNNTLQMARAAKPEYRLSHREVFNPEKARAALGVAVDQFAQFHKEASQLAKVRLDKLKFDAWLQALMITSKMTTVTEAEKVTALPAFQKIRALFEGGGKGSDLSSRAGTAWGAVNAVTEYYDHHSPRSTTDHRMEATWFGDGARAKSAAMGAALALV